MNLKLFPQSKLSSHSNYHEDVSLHCYKISEIKKFSNAVQLTFSHKLQGRSSATTVLNLNLKDIDKRVSLHPLPKLYIQATVVDHRDDPDAVCQIKLEQPNSSDVSSVMITIKADGQIKVEPIIPSVSMGDSELDSDESDNESRSSTPTRVIDTQVSSDDDILSIHSDQSELTVAEPALRLSPTPTMPRLSLWEQTKKAQDKDPVVRQNRKIVKESRPLVSTQNRDKLRRPLSAGVLDASVRPARGAHARVTRPATANPATRIERFELARSASGHFQQALLDLEKSANSQAKDMGSATSKGQRRRRSERRPDTASS